MRLYFAVLAFAELVRVDVVGVRGFSAVYRMIERSRPLPRQHSPVVVDQIVRAVRDAATFYFKSVRCLQRSAAVTRMLRRRGVTAELIIGYQPLPLRSHAWVVVSGQVVSEGVDGLEHYRIVDRW